MAGSKLPHYIFQTDEPHIFFTTAGNYYSAIYFDEGVHQRREAVMLDGLS